MKKKRWVKIIFKDAMGEHSVVHVNRLYVKAHCLNLELPEKDEYGDPIIDSYPIGNIFKFSRAHLPHIGATARE